MRKDAQVRWVVAAAMILGTGCATTQVNTRPAKVSMGQSPPASAKPVAGEGRYVDAELGFEIVRPSGEWQLDTLDERTPEGVSIPVVLRHRESGAQVVVQVAPAVATPTQFAERLTDGLRAQPGFTATDPEPLPLADSAVGFSFAAGTKVQGRVAVRRGSEGRVFMLLATWPANSPAAVSTGVDKIFESVRPI